MISQQLEKYAAAVQEAGYRAWVVPSDAVKKVSELFCLVHVDEQDRNYVIHGMYGHELGEALGSPRTANEIILLQLSMPLPFPVQETMLADTALLLHTLNLLVPVGQFILSEQEGLIIFRTILTHTDEELAPALVVEAIQMARYFTLQFSAFIEPVAVGNVTHLQMIAALSEKGVQLPTITS